MPMSDAILHRHLVFIFLDSKSWTPKILNDIVGRKKIQSECKENQENPLELLPERRSRTKIPGQSSQSTNVLSEKNQNESGNEQTLIKAINFLLTEVFYSRQQSPPEEIMKGETVLAKSLNYLFVDAGNNKF